MAELDYAFVADYAAVDSGKLTAVGASYTQVNVRSFPVVHSFAIAGRVRASADTQSIVIAITVKPPADAPSVVMRGTLTGEQGGGAVYEDKLGVVFAVTNVITLEGPGLAEVLIDIDGVRQRRLAFNVQKV